MTPPCVTCRAASMLLKAFSALTFMPSKSLPCSLPGRTLETASAAPSASRLTPRTAAWAAAALELSTSNVMPALSWMSSAMV